MKQQTKTEITREEILDLKSDIAKLKKTTDQIIDRLDNVKANGNPGLEASLIDLYNKSSEIHEDLKEIKYSITGLTEMKIQINSLVEVTASNRAWSEWGKSTRNLMTQSKMFVLLRTKYGKILLGLLSIFIVNSVLQVANIGFSLQNLVKLFISTIANN